MKCFLCSFTAFAVGVMIGSTIRIRSREQREYSLGFSAGTLAMQKEAVRQGHAQWTNLPVMGRTKFLWFPGRAAYGDAVP
jgi:hypothetical protein